MQLDRGIDWLALTDLWVRLETRYKAENYDGLGGKSTVYVVDRGSPIALVASHAVNHFRDRRPKLADRWTGGLTELLGELLDISVITATRKTGAWDDWSTRQDEFSNLFPKLARSSKLVVDMHGMSDSYGLDMCIGLGPSPAKTEHQASILLEDRLRAFTLRLNDPFPATAPYTITSHLQLGQVTSCIQLELASSVRSPIESISTTVPFLKGLATALYDLNTSLEDSVL